MGVWGREPPRLRGPLRLRPQGRRCAWLSRPCLAPAMLCRTAKSIWGEQTGFLSSRKPSSPRTHIQAQRGEQLSSPRLRPVSIRAGDKKDRKRHGQGLRLKCDYSKQSDISTPARRECGRASSGPALTSPHIGPRWRGRPTSGRLH